MHEIALLVKTCHRMSIYELYNSKIGACANSGYQALFFPITKKKLGSSLITKMHMHMLLHVTVGVHMELKWKWLGNRMKWKE